MRVAEQTGDCPDRSVIKALRKIYPDIKFEVKLITTEGDKDRRTALWDLKSSGFFTSQVEDALISGQADLAVHSFKDLPTKAEQLKVAAVCKRDFAEDCLVAGSRLVRLSNFRHGEDRNIEPAKGRAD